VTGIIFQTPWSALNNTGDNVILINSSNVRIDSVSYQTSWGGNAGGFSLERVSAENGSNEASNWGTCVNIQKATPLNKNSITPKPFDLYLKSFVLTPLFPSAGETLVMDFVIRNSGLNDAGSFTLRIYNDLNFDSVPGMNELINSSTFQGLNSYDSVRYNYSIQNIDSGYKQFIAKVFVNEDNDTLNNVLPRRVFVSSLSGLGNGLIINEIMYDPLSNQSEWIELFNASGQVINIKGWKYKEASTSITISTEDLLINPGDYVILAHDSTLYSSFDYLRTPEANQFIKFFTGISLNNTGETITITDSLNNQADAVTYSPAWNNPEFSGTKGISLERISPSFKSNDRSNWSSCTDKSGGTPGKKNSIHNSGRVSNSKVTIHPHPFSPDGDGYEDFAVISYKLNVSFAQLRVKVFDMRGRLVRTLANNSITGSEGSFIFNGLGDDQQKLRVGIYILLIEAIDNKGGTLDIVKEPVVIAGKL
jgi:hypothetical protein